MRVTQKLFFLSINSLSSLMLHYLGFSPFLTCDVCVFQATGTEAAEKEEVRLLCVF